MTNRYKIIVFLVVVPLVIAISYYLITPKAIISNLSDTDYEEFVIALPSSRISFSPVEAGSSNTIFFSRQNNSGKSSYSLSKASSELFGSDFLYADGSEIGRVLRFTIDSTGNVSLDD
jgi:hypothetical protein